MGSEVIVRGEGSLQVTADLAVVQATVEADGPSREEAYAKAVPMAGQVDAVLAAAGGAIERVVTTILGVNRLTRWEDGQEVGIGWRARRTSSLDVADLTALAGLLADLAKAGASIAGPTWRLRPTNPAYSQVRQLAAEDARSRAEAYAAALGLRVLGVAWVAEPGLRDKGDASFTPRAEMMFASAPVSPGAADGGGDVIQIEAAELTLQAAVEVGFTFTAD
jgi:uncharacterized protein